MMTLKEAANDFLSNKSIAVAGVSRNGASVANAIYKKLREAGHEVFAINPNTDKIEGDKCYPSLTSTPKPIDAVVIATHPKVTTEIIKECGSLGIKNTWIHRSFGQGSYDNEAVNLCKELGIKLIPGSCPLMFIEPVDFGHKCIKLFHKKAKPLGYS